MAYWLSPRSRRPAGNPERLWAAAALGLCIGGFIALLLAAPAVWLGMLVTQLSAGRVHLLQPSGTVWRGQATLALGAGPDSPTTLALPERLSWNITWFLGSGGLPGLHMDMQQPAVLLQAWRWRIQPGWSSIAVELTNTESTKPAARLPAAWLSGLGAPWNTLQPSGQLVLSWDRLLWTSSGGTPPSWDAALQLQLVNIGSRVSTLPVLGQYVLDIRGSTDWTLQLRTLPGSALQLQGQGRWSPGREVQFRGEAWASTGREEALSNLLNIIGRREGPRSVMAFGAPAGAAPPARPPE